MGKVRFLLPFFMFIAGTIVAIQLITTVTTNVPSTHLFPETMSTTLGTDIATVMAIAIPILVIEYMLFTVPIAVILLLITKVVKSARYEMNIMNKGANSFLKIVDFVDKRFFVVSSLCQPRRSRDCNR